MNTINSALLPGVCFIFIPDFHSLGQRLLHSWGLDKSGVESVKTTGFLKHEVRGKKGSRVPERHGREGPTQGLRSAGCVICMVTDWVPRIMGEEATRGREHLVRCGGRLVLVN